MLRGGIHNKNQRNVNKAEQKSKGRNCQIKIKKGLERE
jgi:hypothetical protein